MEGAEGTGGTPGSGAEQGGIVLMEMPGMECNYAREPFDLRLTVLRLFKKAPVIVLAVLLGTLVFGGGYYLVKVVLPETMYGAESVYCVEYAVDPNTENEYTYINEMSWNTWLHTKDCLDDVEANLGFVMDREELSGAISGAVKSDVRMPSTLVVTKDPELSLKIAGALEKSFVNFARRQKQIDSIQVVTPAEKAEKVLLDARPVRACILSALLSCFVIVVILMLKETGDDAIWLPAVISGRYGRKTLGTAGSKSFAENVEYLFRDMDKVGVVPVREDIRIGEVIDVLKDAGGQELSDGKQPRQWLAAPSVTENPECSRFLRDMDGVLLVVKAGAHAGKSLEYALEYLDNQDCPVTAVLLWQADEALIRAYYWLPKGRNAALEKG